MIRLSEARLCLDCEVVFKGAFCPKCGAARAPFIARWLNRGPQKEVKEYENAQKPKAA